MKRCDVMNGMCQTSECAMDGWYVDGRKKPKERHKTEEGPQTKRKCKGRT